MPPGLSRENDESETTQPALTERQAVAPWSLPVRSMTCQNGRCGIPSFSKKQSGFTSQSNREPNGQPRNNESMSIVTCRGDHTYGRCKSGTVTLPSSTEPNFTCKEVCRRRTSRSGNEKRPSAMPSVPLKFIRKTRRPRPTFRYGTIFDEGIGGASDHSSDARNHGRRGALYRQSLVVRGQVDVELGVVLTLHESVPR